MFKKVSNPKFKSAKEEIDFLRLWVEIDIKDNAKSSDQIVIDDIVHEALLAHKSLSDRFLLHRKMRLNKNSIKKFASEVHQLGHDMAMEELLGFMLENGVKNTLNTLSHISNPRLRNDFYLYLVRSIGPDDKKLKLREASSYFRAYDMRVVQISLPNNAFSEDSENLSKLESLIARICNTGFDLEGGVDNKISLEIFFNDSGKPSKLCVALPSNKISLLENEVDTIFDGAEVAMCSTDPIASILSGSETAFSIAKFSGKENANLISNGKTSLVGEIIKHARIYSNCEICVQFIISPDSLGLNYPADLTAYDYSFVDLNIRIIVKSGSANKSHKLIQSITSESNFNFGKDRGEMVFCSVPSMDSRKVLQQTMYRRFDNNNVVSVSLRELASLIGL